MKQTILFLAIICQSCMSSLPLVITQAEYQSIPNGTNAIEVTTDLPPDSLYKIILRKYAQAGCPVRGDKEALQIICEGLPTTHSGSIYAIANIIGSTVQITAQSVLSNQQANNVRIISGLYSYQAGKEPVTFIKNSGNKNYYFQHLIKLNQTIPGTITYLKK